jgi:hypothetical protein
MTEAQWKVRLEQITADSNYEYRAFRKKCVTQGIVTFSRENGSSYYIMRYRDRFVTTLWGESYEKIILAAARCTIFTTEKTIKKIECVKHEGK